MANNSDLNIIIADSAIQVSRLGQFKLPLEPIPFATQLIIKELEEIKEKLPTVYENCQSFAGLDPSKDLIPIAPASHYTMGGVPTNSDCQVIRFQDGIDQKIDGLYAIGEAACISVHGAGRLGCNSLLDLLVFAKKSVESLELYDNRDFIFDDKQVSHRISSVFEGNVADINQITDALKVFNQFLALESNHFFLVLYVEITPIT